MSMFMTKLKSLPHLLHSGYVEDLDKYGDYFFQQEYFANQIYPVVEILSSAFYIEQTDGALHHFLLDLDSECVLTKCRVHTCTDLGGNINHIFHLVL